MVADEGLFARLRGLSPDELADRANEMMLHSYCCVVHEAWAKGASAPEKPPVDEKTGDAVGPPRVEQGTLIFWRTGDGTPTGTNPTRFTFSLEPGAVR